MKSVCRFTFAIEVDREAVEAQLALTIVVAECMFGQARVRLGAAYLMSEDGRRLALDVSSEVGEYITQLFTGLLIREMGEESFSVERIQSAPDAAAPVFSAAKEGVHS